MSDIEVMELSRKVCCTCGTVFALSEHLNDQRKHDFRPFWCPNGHAQQFIDREQSAKEDAKKQLAVEREKSAALAAQLGQVKTELAEIKNSRWWKRRQERELKALDPDA